MIPSEIRKEAREALKGNWRKAAYIILAYFLVTLLISCVMSAFENNKVVYWILYIIEVAILTPISFGLTISFIKLKRGEDTTSFSFIKEGFSRFTKSWGIWINIFVRLLLPFICMILVIMLMGLLMLFSIPNKLISILGVAIYLATIVYAATLSLLYSIAYYIAYDNENMKANECVKKSAELMKGNRGNLFLLVLSFIGWILLGTLSLGIGFIWIIPYIQVTLVCFYERVSKIEPKKVDGNTKIEE